MNGLELRFRSVFPDGFILHLEVLYWLFSALLLQRVYKRSFIFRFLLRRIIAFVGALASGMYFVVDCRGNTDGGVSMNQDDQPLEDIVKGKDPEENQKMISAADYLFSARPVEAGQSSEIMVAEQLGSRESIERIILLEDGTEVAAVEGSYLSHEVVREDQGTHTYTAELHTTLGRKIETDPIDIEFAGHKIDFPPYIQSFFASTEEAGKATNILIDARDIGDDRGIKRITLFEDGTPRETVEQSDSVLRTVQYETPQTHEYYAEIEDNGGNVITSEKITVNYTGEAFPPEVSWCHAIPEDAGRTTRILVEGKDKKNYDGLQGIARIVLYEDGRQIREMEGSSLLFEVTHHEAGTHRYHAEIYNKNNKKATTKTFIVHFAGQDFPPEIDWWHVNYKPEENLATVVVQAKDKKNVRDDAGIKQIVLFENGTPIKTVADDTLLTELKRQPGEYTYYSEVTNTSGLTTKTEERKVLYQASE